jgi:stage III sporulation protein AB
MTLKLIGAAFIILGCGGFGFRLAAIQKRDEHLLIQLINVLDYLCCELRCHMPPLPQLCKLASQECSGVLSSIFATCSQELERQTYPHAQTCMETAIGQFPGLPKITATVLNRLAHSLGQFDLEGQLEGLENIKIECRRQLSTMLDNRDARLRTYQTLGLCAGAALVIIFI